MRRGEMAKLTWADFDRETWWLTLPGRITRARRGVCLRQCNTVWNCNPGPTPVEWTVAVRELLRAEWTTRRVDAGQEEEDVGDLRSHRHR